MSMIQIKNLSFAYDGCESIFENVSLNLDTQWRLALCGRNGRGKTTLLRLLTGELIGQGKISAAVNFEYFPYEFGTGIVRDEIARLVPAAEDWEVLRELGELNVGMDVLYRPASTLSGGEKVKAQLAALFLRENAFLLIDEPTNHLDEEGRKSVAAYLRKKQGYILVSHDRAFLNACVDHVLSINRKSVELISGDYAAFEAARENTQKAEQKQNDKLQKQIGDLTAAARRAEGWSDTAERSKSRSADNDFLAVDRGFMGAKAAKMMRSAKSVMRRADKAATEKKALLLDAERIDSLNFSPLDYPKETLVYAKDFSVCFGGKKVFDPLSFTLRRGDRLAVRGQNGCGKTSLLRAISGLKTERVGTLQVGSGLIVSVVAQNTDDVCGKISDFFSAQNGDAALFRAVLAKLEVRADALEGDLKNCSMGQKKKLLLAKSLSTRAHLYLWDEPLNYVDVISRKQIEQALKQSNATVVFVEHDRAFSDAVATAEIGLTKHNENGTIVGKR